MSRYWVFGRRRYADPLEQQGALEAPDEDSARREAHSRFPGEWVELVLVPESEVHWVLGPEREAQGVAGQVD